MNTPTPLSVNLRSHIVAFWIQQIMAHVLFVPSCLASFKVQDFSYAIVHKSISNKPITTHLYMCIYIVHVLVCYIIV